MTGPPVSNDPVARARMMLQAGQWAAARFRAYDHGSVRNIVAGVARAGHEHATALAKATVEETGYGVAEDKATKNRIASLGIAEHYDGDDFVTPRVDAQHRIVEVPKPAGVIFALIPSTNPVSTLYFKVILALMTRNAVVVSPHPGARQVCMDACALLRDAALQAGAPRGTIQIVDEPSIPLIEALMGDPHTNVILATGGTGVVRAAYQSGTPAIGVGPGNAPVMVDRTADAAAAAKDLVDSKAFDNSLLCSAESVLIADAEIAKRLTAELTRAGAHICAPEETERLRSYLFPDGHLNLEAVGQSAATVARSAGIRTSTRTRLLVTPLALVIPEEPLASEKMCPVLGLNIQPDPGAAIRAARAVLRVAGAGHSAAIHSNDPDVVIAFSEALDVLRVVVNAPNSTGVAGFDTNVAPTMTVGTGFTGRSSLGENLEPRHLVNWSRVAYNKNEAIAFPDFEALRPWERIFKPQGIPHVEETTDASQELREQIRQLVLEELRDLVGSR
ncbi:MAG TPA: aldehyde dehydrogenase family protein [Solirubrobacteraceae bacterium]|nr:aldehyde dehydrogenase family protein [Solirubrobacteraceae bacterium]